MFIFVWPIKLIKIETLHKTVTNEIPVYLMPGMGASPKIFEFWEFPAPYRLERLSWIPPFAQESLQAYAARMWERIPEENPVLVGVSFGGVLVQEMAKLKPVRQLILVSSIKSTAEMPLSMRMATYTRLHKYLPLRWVQNVDTLALFAFGEGIKKRLEMYQKYLSERDPDYLAWAIDALVHWKQDSFETSLLHFHGHEDTIFPIKNIAEPVQKLEGGHAIVLTQYRWFNENLPLLLNNPKTT